MLHPNLYPSQDMRDIVREFLGPTGPAKPEAGKAIASRTIHKAVAIAGKT